MSVGVYKNGEYVKTAGLAKDPAVFTPATETTNGTTGLVVAPLAGDQNKFLRGDGTWANGGSIDLADNDTYEALEV